MGTSVNEATANIYIAIVDDDESLCRSVARLFRASGYVPVTYPSAEAFLADSKQPVFACLVLDIQLNGMSGIELAQRLIELGSSTPVVILSAKEKPEAAERMHDLARHWFVSKSDSGAELLAAIDEAIYPNRKTLKNEMNE